MFVKLLHFSLLTYKKGDMLKALDQKVFTSFGFSQLRTRFSEEQYDI
jgi:hypothetical protein